jgi:caa(3)-type oxidase subunit IV
MALQHPTTSSYWRTWLFLLILTMIMIGVDQLAVPRGLLVLILVAAMLLKASLIGANFMHLRYERAGLVIVVTAALLLTGAALFLGIAPDGARIRRLGPESISVSPSGSPDGR